MKVKTFAEAQQRYGAIVNGKWANEGKWMVVCPIPADIAAQMKNNATGGPTNKIYMNKEMVKPFLSAIDNLKKNGLLKDLKTFDGCFMIRNVRRSKTAASCHSYGLAIDINAAENALGKEPLLSSAFVKCFTDAGFTWGGNFRRKDGMHFSYGWE